MDRVFKYFFSKEPPKIEDMIAKVPLSLDKRELEDTSEFEEYLQSIPQELKKMKRRKTTRSVTSNTVRMELLEKCYRNIPNMYFLQKGFNIQFKMFYRNKRKSQQSQDKVYQYLDEIQLCLFNQVTSRFDQFLSVMMAIESMDYLLKDNIEKISYIRRNNKAINEGLIKKAKKIAQLQTLLKKKKQVYELLTKINLLRKATTTIKANVNKNKEKCLTFIQELKNNKSLFQPLSCANNYNQVIQECESIIKRDFTETFSQDTFNYIISASHYNPQFWQRLSNRNDLINETINELESTMILYEEDLWQQDKKNPIDKQFEVKILDIILNGWKNGDLGVGPTKAKIDQHITNLFNIYTKDIKQFSSRKLKEKGENVEGSSLELILEKMSLDFYGKVLEYYSYIHKRYLKRTLSLFKLILNNLLELSTKLEADLVPRMSNLIEGIFNMQLFMIKIILEKVIQLLNFKKIHSDIEYNEFKNYIALLENWEKFFQNQASPLIQYTIPTDSPMKERVYILKNRINAAYLTNNKNGLITSYFMSLHKFILTQELKQVLQNDCWIAADIPTDYYDSIGYLISGESWISARKNMQSTMMMESSLFVDRDYSNSSGHHRRNSDRSSFMKIDEILEKQSKINIKIIKNECIVQGKTYKITQAFLLLIEILQEYVKISECFPIIKQEVSIKLFELCKYYNQYTLKLIIGGGACAFQKIKSKSITARHLALSSLCLEFLIFILKKIFDRIKIFNFTQLIENISLHNAQISNKLNSILMSKINQNLDLIDLKLPPSKGTQAIVSSTSTLYYILTEYFTSDRIRKIFSKQIFQKFLDRIKKMEVKQLQQAQIYKQEVTFFFTQLKFLDGIIYQYGSYREDAESMIMRIFQSL